MDVITFTITCRCPVLSLEIEFEVKVSLVKLVYSHITVFSATSIAFTIGMKLDRVDGTEVTWK